MSFLDDLENFLSPMKRAVLNMVGKAVIKAVDDTQKLQLMKIQTNADELQDEVERIQQYGFTSHPQNNAEAIILAIGGDPSNLIVIGTDDTRYRIKLAQGEVALYDDQGQFIKLKRNNKIEVKGGEVIVGEDADIESIVIGDSLKTYIDSLLSDVFSSWVIVAGDGGAALKTLFTAWNTAHSTDDYLSSKHKVEK